MVRLNGWVASARCLILAESTVAYGNVKVPCTELLPLNICGCLGLWDGPPQSGGV